MKSKLQKIFEEEKRVPSKRPNGTYSNEYVNWLEEYLISNLK